MTEEESINRRRKIRRDTVVGGGLLLLTLWLGRRYPGVSLMVLVSLLILAISAVTAELGIAAYLKGKEESALRWLSVASPSILLSVWMMRITGIVFALEVANKYFRWLSL